MNQTENTTKVITGLCTFSYLNCWEPRAFNGSSPRYSVCLIIPKSDTQTVEKIRRATQAAWQKWQAVHRDSNGPLPDFSDLTDPLHDGDLEHPDIEAYRNSWYINAKSPFQPGVVDAERHRITDHSQMYSGVIGRASVELYVYNREGNVGIACGLNHLQKVFDGTPLGGRSSAEDDFLDLDALELPF